MLVTRPHAVCARGARALAHKYISAVCLQQRDITTKSEKQTLKQPRFQGCPKSTLHVQVSIDSRSSAIHSAYRSLLRPSLLLKPRHPSLNVVCAEWLTFLHRNAALETCRQGTRQRGLAGRSQAPTQAPQSLRSCWGRTHVVHLQTESHTEQLAAVLRNVCE